jgi:hypothetical protein
MLVFLHAMEKHGFLDGFASRKASLIIFTHLVHVFQAQIKGCRRAVELAFLLSVDSDLDSFIFTF